MDAKDMAWHLEVKRRIITALDSKDLENITIYYLKQIKVIERKEKKIAQRFALLKFGTA